MDGQLTILAVTRKLIEILLNQLIVIILVKFRNIYFD